MIITQVHLVLGTRKWHCKMCSCNTMPHVLRVCAIGLLTAGMSTRAVARSLTFHFSTINRLQLHFIDVNLNVQIYRDEILRPIVVPLIFRHHLMFQHDNGWPHVARICTQFLKMSQFLHGLHTRQTCHLLSTFGVLWIEM